MNAGAFYPTSITCRKCSNEIYKRKTKIRIRQQREILCLEGYKFCTKCEEIKTLDCYGVHTRSKDGYRNHCKICTSKGDRGRYNPEKRKQYHIKNKEQENKSNRQWRINNPEKVKAYNKVYERNRRAHKLHNGGSFTLEEWKALVWYLGEKCLCCKKIKFLEIDHIVPITKGGSSYISNLQPLCRSCNSIKRTQIIDYRPEPILD